MHSCTPPSTVSRRRQLSRDEACACYEGISSFLHCAGAIGVAMVQLPVSFHSACPAFFLLNLPSLTYLCHNRSASHPAVSARPPTGVTAPSQRCPLRTMTYSEPLNRQMPALNKAPAVFVRANDASPSATLCTR